MGAILCGDLSAALQLFQKDSCQLSGPRCVWERAEYFGIEDSEVEWEAEWEVEWEEDDEAFTESPSTTVRTLKKLTSVLQLSLRILMPKVPEDADSTVSEETAWEAWLL